MPLEATTTGRPLRLSLPFSLPSRSSACALTGMRIYYAHRLRPLVMRVYTGHHIMAGESREPECRA